MAPVTYIPGFIVGPDACFEALWTQLAWERRLDAPRREYWTNTFDRPYTYGRGLGTRTYEPSPTHPIVDGIRERLAEDFGCVLEGCFLNGYEGKRDWLGWHSDDDPRIDHAKPIAVVTVGQGRNIQFREVLAPRTETTKAVHGETVTVMLEAGSLLLMHAGMQSTHEHRIPKADFEAKPRISLTYRGLVPTL